MAAPVEPSEPWDATFAHKPWIIKHEGVVYHYYCAVGNEGRVIALATARTCGAEDHNMKLKLVIEFSPCCSPRLQTSPRAPADDEAAYTQAIEKRTADIISALDLKDEAKAARVRDAI
jgi:hypothetical protein